MTVTPNPNSPNPTPAPSPATPFSVASVTPASGATQVATSAPILITFSGAANAATVNTIDIKLTGANNTAVAGTVTYNATTNVATFTPAAALTAGATYTLTVNGVTSSSGTAMAAAFTSTFTTVAPPPAPVATVQYQAPLLGSSSSVLNGQISIDITGSVTVKLTAAAVSTTYTLQFCTAVAESASANSAPACTTLGKISTDADGNATLTMMFPKPGSWAGDFSLNSGTTQKYGTGLVPGLNGETYMSTLQPSTMVNGTGLGNPGYAGESTTQAPLTSGTVTYAKGSATYTVMGTLPNTGFYANESEDTYVDSSGTYETATFTTDAKGDATSSSSSFGPGGDLFQVNPQDGVGFIGGFSVPK